MKAETDPLTQMYRLKYPDGKIETFSGREICEGLRFNTIASNVIIACLRLEMSSVKVDPIATP